MANDTSTEELETAAADDSEEFQFVEPPAFDVAYKGDCAYEVKVSVPSANKDKKASEMFDELKHEAEIPGFRRGRAPLKLVERKFAKAVRADVAGKLVSAAFLKLVKDEALRPIGTPDIDGLEDAGELSDEAPLEFTLKFDVAPRVELGRYRGIDVERPFIVIDDQDVDESVQEIRERHAVFEALKKNGKAKDGDQVIIDFKGTRNGEDLPGGQAENFPYTLGSTRFLPEFEKVLLKSSAGDELTCEVTFPDDYYAADLRGEKAQFAITVHEVKRRKIPNATDEFAEEAGFENLTDMREKIRLQLEEAAATRSRQIAESRALNSVIEASTFEISPKVIEVVASEHTEDEIRRLMGLRVPHAVIHERMDEITAKAKASAVRTIQTMVALNEIAEAEGIEVTEEDFDKEAETLSKSLGADTATVAQYLASSDQRDTFSDRIYRAKALAAIMDNAVIEDKELTRDEMDAEEAASAEDTGESD